MSAEITQESGRPPGIPGALVDTLSRSLFLGKPVEIMPGDDGFIDKLITRFFKSDSDATVMTVAGSSVELEEEWAGDALYTMRVDLVVSAKTVRTEIDTLHRLTDWLVDGVAADPNLGGQAIHSAVVEATFVQRAGSKRVVLEATVAISYTRNR